MLRFGDGTPFPLDEGFLHVLVDVVSTCTAMLTTTADLEERHARARMKQQELLAEAHQLERFEQTVRMAARTSPAANGSEPMPAEQATRHTIAAMQHAMQSSREQLKNYAQAIAAEFEWTESARQVELAVGGFFERHELPGMVWSWSWDATPGRSCFEARARGARFTVDFDLERDVLWRAPIRIAALAPGVVMDLPRRRWLGKPTVTSMPLDRYLLVGAQWDPDGRSLTIQERAGAAPGWRITLPNDGAPSATAFDRRGRTIAVGFVALPQIAALLDAIDLQMRARLSARRARTVLVAGAPVSTIDDTTTAARALLDEIGPIVREIRTRSLVPGELSIKRDVAAGVREELFVSRTQLAACYASLPTQYRHLLDAIGVGRGLTEGVSEDSSTTLAPPSAVPRPTPQRVDAHPPPIPQRPRAHTPTKPVKSLRAIPIQNPAAAPKPWMSPRPATRTA